MATSVVGTTNGTSSQSSSSTAGQNTALQNLDINQFLKLMISELQNQDPLNPMDNSQMLQQIGTMREIAANSKLTDTLDSVLLSQNVAAASNLIGKQVRALTDDGREVVGAVDKVSIVDNLPKLNIGSDQVQLTNVREIINPTPATTGLTN